MNSANRTKMRLVVLSRPLFVVAIFLHIASIAVADNIEFNRDIRPILSDHCFACHGPDKNKREADLRLDTESGLIGGDAESGAVIPGDAEASLLIQRINSHDAHEQMPPPEFGKDLSDLQRELLRQWIQQGAPWEGHWSFQPLKRAPLPAVVDERFAAHPVDRFIAAALPHQGLAAAPRESPRALVRRLSFDLLGLPPDPAVADRFAEDPTDAAFERLVDQFLESPHFGERMAIWWLDLVRYADSAGYHGDQPVSVAPFRDYVIQSFNDNKPFDQFTIEQLAGDLLADRTEEQWIASGYNRLGMMSAEGGVQPKEYLAKYISERVRNLSGVWLGVTIGCSECHDHKYDPFTSKEFYQFEAFFADIEEQGLYNAGSTTNPWGPSIPVPSDEQRLAYSQAKAEIERLSQVLNTTTDALQAAQREWESQTLPWFPLQADVMESLNGVTLLTQDDGSILASGENPSTDTYTLTFNNVPQEITALRLEVLPHDSLPNKGPGRAGNGNFVLSEIEAYGSDGTPIVLQNPTATYEQTGAADGNPYGKWAVAAAVDRDEKGVKWGWAVMEQAGKANSAVFEISPGSTSKADGSLRIVLKQNLDNTQHTLGHFRLSATTAPLPVKANLSVPTDVEQILRVADTERTAEQKDKLAVYYRSIAPELNETRNYLSQQQALLSKLDSEIPTTLVTKSVPPRPVRVLPRGNWMDESGELVQPEIPSWIGGTESTQEPLDRLDLANWVVDPKNPLTARALTNRLWKQFFGAGLSRKLDDLGAQGEWPSHPELLDYLAAEWIDSGWDVKRLIKSMVMSETYRQSSFASAETQELDPYNRWLSHQSRWRLDAELIRDNALAISGLLVEELGGPSVKPFQPAGYWAYLNFPQREWQSDTGSQLFRRGLYTHWQRQYLHPSLLAFDAPSREECAADRSRSNTPLQALVLLNDPCYVEAARAFAQRILTEGGNEDLQRLQWSIHQSLGRDIRPAETELLMQLLESQRPQFVAQPQSADQLLSVRTSPIDANLDRTELAAWTSIARTILNLHETITRN